MKSSPPSEKQLREFGLLVGFLFPFLIGWLLPTLFAYEIRLWTIFVSSNFNILGLFSPKCLKFFYKKARWKYWQFLAFLNNHIILGFVFIFVMHQFH